MQSKERVIYILKILVLICILVWLLYTDEESYVEDYNAKIEALEAKVDSLHTINDDLSIKIDTLNTQILSLASSPVIKSLITNFTIGFSNRIEVLSISFCEKLIKLVIIKIINSFNFFISFYS